MNITIIGAGNMGRGLIKQLSKAGHQITVTARELDKAAQLAAEFPGVRAATRQPCARPCVPAIPACWAVAGSFMGA